MAFNDSLFPSFPQTPASDLGSRGIIGRADDPRSKAGLGHTQGNLSHPSSAASSYAYTVSRDSNMTGTQQTPFPVTITTQAHRSKRRGRKGDRHDEDAKGEQEEVVFGGPKQSSPSRPTRTVRAVKPATLMGSPLLADDVFDGDDAFDGATSTDRGGSPFRLPQLSPKRTLSGPQPKLSPIRPPHVVTTAPAMSPSERRRGLAKVASAGVVPSPSAFVGLDGLESFDGFERFESSVVALAPPAAVLFPPSSAPAAPPASAILHRLEQKVQKTQLRASRQSLLQ